MRRQTVYRLLRKKDGRSLFTIEGQPASGRNGLSYRAKRHHPPVTWRVSTIKAIRSCPTETAEKAGFANKRWKSKHRSIGGRRAQGKLGGWSRRDGFGGKVGLV